ncbi:MAG: hypothetical protein U5L02_06250 [Rheinheimera sp.]|nr:hypothetical protein [Rheinheimera sp.]
MNQSKAFAKTGLERAFENGYQKHEHMLVVFMAAMLSKTGQASSPEVLASYAAQCVDAAITEINKMHSSLMTIREGGAQ